MHRRCRPFDCHSTRASRRSPRVVYVICLLSAVLLVLSISGTAQGQLFSWTGGGTTNNWSEAANWGGVVPTSGSADLLFANSSNPFPFNNLGTFDLELLFLSAPTYIISGNPLRFSTTTPELTASSGTHLINNDIIISQPLEVQVNSGVTLNLDGNLSGSADITKIQGGLLVLDGSNGSWSGDLDIQAGTVRFDPGDALSVNSDVHVAAGATADFSPEGEGFGGFSGAGHLEFGNTVDIFSNFSSNGSFSGTASGVNAHIRKQGPATLSLTSGADIDVDQLTVQNGAVSVGNGAEVTTANTNVDLGASLSLAANATYHSEGGLLVLGTLTTNGGDITMGQFSNLTIREFGIWNLDDTGNDSTKFTQAILNVNDSAELRMFGDVSLDHSFLNIEDTDLFGLFNTGVDIVAENISYINIGALTGIADSNTLDLDSNSTITLNSGSMLRTNWIRLGFSDSQANIIMDGAGTLLDAPYAIDVGHEGPGELTISGGAQVESFTGAVGRNSGGSGLLTITGTDESNNPSSWMLESDLNIGLLNSTAGEVHVLDGAELSAVVLTVGSNGDGSLTIESGSSVSNSSTVLGRNGNSTGTVTVSGPDSTWTNSGELVVGFLGTGTLTIEAGGNVENTVGRIGFDTGSTGIVTVTGAGSTWTNTQFLQLGVGGNVGAAGSGELTVSDGGTVSSASGHLGINLGWTGTVTVTGVGSTWNSGGVIVGSEGEGILTIANGGQVSSNFGSIGDSIDSTGAVAVTGATSTWNNSGDLLVGRSGSGTLTISGGGSVESSNGFIGRFFSATGLVNVNGTGSTWTNNGQLSIGGNADTGFNGGSGTLRIQSGGMANITGNTTLFPDGLLRLEGGTLATSMIAFEGGGTFEWSAGILHVGVFDGNLTNPSGGTLAPGESAGSTTIVGDYTQQTGATLQVEIGGTSPGGTHDLVSITGTAVLSGELQLAILDGFLPDPNDNFTVFNTAGGILGVFSNITTGLRLETMDGIGSFQVDYGVDSEFDPTQIVLSEFQLNPTFTADFDEDGDVDNADLGIWEMAYRITSLADADGDGDSDGSDFLQWQEQFTGSLPLATSAAAVPESATWIVLLSGLMAFSLCRRIP